MAIMHIEHYEGDSRCACPLIPNGTINQSIKVICNVRNVVHKLESEVPAVASEHKWMSVINPIRHYHRNYRIILLGVIT